jgi:hypothetical protein
MKKTKMAVVLLGVLVITGISHAALIHQWALDETSLTWNGTVWVDVIDSVPGNPTGQLWGYTSTSPVNTTVINQPGVPLYTGDTAYNFTESTGISAAFLNNMSPIPTTGDFTVKVWMNTTNLHTAQGHLFSNNNNQAGRANLYLLNGALAWFQNGGVSLVDATADKGSIFDGNWHEVGIARQGDRFDLLRDGLVVATGNSTTAFTTTQSWMIGRMRASNGDYEGSIADVKVYDTYIPEPATLLLLGLGAMLVRKTRIA